MPAMPPPSTSTSVPVRPEAASETRSSTTAVTSSARSSRFNAVASIIRVVRRACRSRISACADERDEMRCVHGKLAGLRGLDEFEGHGHAGGGGAGAFGDPLPKSHSGEGRLDRVCRAQVDPMFSRVVVERQQRVDLIGDLRDGLGPLGADVELECFTATSACFLSSADGPSISASQLIDACR